MEERHDDFDQIRQEKIQIVILVRHSHYLAF
jgi:hypothetical protein